MNCRTIHSIFALHADWLIQVGFREKLRVRKRFASLRRILGYQVTRELYPFCAAPRAWWWHYDSNFGDLLTPYILPRYGIAPILKPTNSIDMIGIGSILAALPDGYEGIVWGTGSTGNEEVLPSQARVLAVRGKLTWARLGEPDITALGDPGLLMRELVPSSRKRWRLGVVPHLTHRKSPVFEGLLAQDGVKFIDVSKGPRRVARDISSCSAIVSSSLHGVILADSYGIPASWSIPEPVVNGGDFKFLDHETAVNPPSSRQIFLKGDEIVADLISGTVCADSIEVEARIEELKRSLSILGEEFGKTVRPWSLWRLQARE